MPAPALLSWLAALLSASAGFGLFLLLLNRRLIMIPDSPWKTPLIGMTGLALSGSGGALGLRGAELPWLLLGPAGILSLLATGEVRRYLIRRRCAGSPPELVGARPGAVTTTRVQVARFRIHPGAWSGRPFRIAQISDLHVTDRLPFSYC